MPQLEARLGQPVGTAPVSTKVIVARIVSAVPILFLTFDAVIKLVRIAPVVDAFAQLGYSITLAPAIGALSLVCTAVYTIPRTSLRSVIFRA